MISGFGAAGFAFGGRIRAIWGKWFGLLGLWGLGSRFVPGLPGLWGVREVPRFVGVAGVGPGFAPPFFVLWVSGWKGPVGSVCVNAVRMRLGFAGGAGWRWGKACVLFGLGRCLADLGSPVRIRFVGFVILG
jgi:hypothetical protein